MSELTIHIELDYILDTSYIDYPDEFIDEDGEVLELNELFV